MQANEILHLTQAEYAQGPQHYVVSEYLMGRLAGNHIQAKEVDRSALEGSSQKGSGKVKGKRMRYIYAQQMLYLTYIAEYHHFQALSAKTTRQEWEALKQQDILSIYSHLSEKGYNKLQFVQFYLKIRKKSKLIERFCEDNLQASAPMYKIYKTVEDFKQKAKGEIYYLVETTEKLSNILTIKQKYQKNSTIKVQILSNLDGITIMSKPSFSIIERSIQDDGT